MDQDGSENRMSEIGRIIRDAGEALEPPRLSLETIRTAVLAREARRRRLIRGTVLGVGAVAVTGGVWASSMAQTDPTPTAAPPPTTSLMAVGSRPACPPDPGTVSLTDRSTGVGRFGPTIVLAQSTGSIGLTLSVPQSKMADRHVSEARLILVKGEAARGDASRGQVFDDPNNQVAEAVISRPGTEQDVALPLPSGLAPGEYAIIYKALFPGPSLCGQENPIPATMTGTMYQEVATVQVP